MDENIYAYLGFSHFLGIGPMRFTSLVACFGSPQKAYQANEKEIEKAIGFGIAQKFVEFRAMFNPEKKYEELLQKHITVITREDAHYPSRLLNISDPPICLYVKGTIDWLNDPKLYTIAIVGTRKPSSYGQQIARKFSSELAQLGFIIVSGMAMGIDGISHRSCIDAGGKTIGVLGCGVDIMYPAVNRLLYEDVLKKGGVIISEFPPGHTVLKGLFVSRNRIISGLSQGVMIVEGLKHSGALITARFAAEQGREVFAPPAPINSDQSEAPNILLKEGATLVTSVEDILKTFNIEKKIIPASTFTNKLTIDQNKILVLLSKEPLCADELLMETNWDRGNLFQAISTLEIMGLIEKNNEGKYIIK